MVTSDSNSSPNKRQKTETLTLEPSISPSSSNRKALTSDNLATSSAAFATAYDGDGYESPSQLPPQNCGICLSEKGKSVRGVIDSCDHYFCFLCILEWSKAESRCPLCRARFGKIRRLRKDGTGTGNGFVRVPVRDQIRDPFGEPSDPYGQAKCTVCNGTTDDSLLLLCDLCGLPSHTYCVGLGATVPEGDWYCRDCSLLWAEQCEDEANTNVDALTSTLEHVDEASATAAVSIFDIVRESEISEPSEPDPGVERLMKLVSPPKKILYCTPIASDEVTVAFPGPVSLRGTLLNSRNGHGHVSVLRENWGAFRTGSLRFFPGSLESSGKGRRKKKVVATCAERSCSRLQSFPSTSSLQSKAQGILSDPKPSKQPYDEDRAWKLMNKAKSMQQVGKPKSALKTACSKGQVKAANVASKCLPDGRKNLRPLGSGKPNRTDDAIGRLALGSGQRRYSKSVAGSTSSCTYQNSNVSRLSSSRKGQTLAQAGKYQDRASAPSLGKLGRELPTVFNDSTACSASSRGSIVKSFDVPCTKFRSNEISTCPMKLVGNENTCIANQTEVTTSDQADICHDRTVCLPSQENLGGRLSNVFNEQKNSTCSTSSRRPVTDARSASSVKLEGQDTSGCPNKVNSASNSKPSKNDEAKGEIQSLVKLNLKLLSKDKRLGADAFKEIARLSTHTVLAACGFEHRKIVNSHPSPAAVCHHGDQNQLLQRSALLPRSCTDCFNRLVKNVVNSIMSEKLSNVRVAL